MDDDVVIEPDASENGGGSEEELEAVESRADAKVTKLRKELEQARKEKQENLDGWQRAKADYVNAVKRFEDERQRALELGKIVSAQAFLPALDSLARAKTSGEQLPEGFAGIAKQLESGAKALGLEQIGSVGEQFNPSLHEALGQDAAESESEDDTITAVLESGWKIGDSILRPAKVRVAHFNH